MLFAVVLFVTGVNGFLLDQNPCQTKLQGACMDLFAGLNGDCPAGHKYTLNYCGEFKMCCYTDQTISGPIVTQAPGGSSGAACGQSTFTHTVKMLGGTLAQHGQFPWQVSLQYMGAIGKQHLCGGTLIDPQWVITAGHCFAHVGARAHEWMVALGVENQKTVPLSSMVRVSHIYRHEFFHDNPMTNDITLMKLAQPVDVSGISVRAACLPSPTEMFESDMCVISGWGAHYYDPSGHAPVASNLEYEVLRTMPNAQCQYYMGYNAVKQSNICAGKNIDFGGTGPCQGDSGGPLVCQKNGAWTLAGIISWGLGCAEAHHPGIYTRVTSYMAWIEDKMRHN